MGSFLLKKAVGLSNISDLLDKSGIFYNYSTKVLPSFDYDTAGKHIAREDSTWNGKYVIGQPAEVTYSFPKWEGKFNQFGNKNPYEFNELPFHGGNRGSNPLGVTILFIPVGL